MTECFLNQYFLFHSRKMHLGKFLFLVLNVECFYGS